LTSAVLALAAIISPPVRASAQQSKNPNLAREIRHQLAELPFYSAFDFITFALDGNNVTLTGQVVRPSLKKHAEEAIKSLEGVESVNDQIEVLPKSERDDELRRAIYRAIYEDPLLQGYAVQAVPPIHIIVKDGSVTLEGTVNTANDKSLAAKRASTVENVMGLKNNLKVPTSPNAAE
jgi:hyperosmotically inducible protein